MNWSVAIQTAPRREPTLDRCAAAVVAAGWPAEEVRIVCDGTDAPRQRAGGHPVTVLDDRRAAGAFPTYFLTLAQMAMRDPDADAYLYLQDDALLPGGHDVRRYLAGHVLWPEPAGRVGFLSLFASAKYDRSLSPGWHRHAGRFVYGAVALLFPRSALLELLAWPFLWTHRLTPKHRPGHADRSWHPLRNLDVVTDQWRREAGRSVWYPPPSLVRHVGDASAIWTGARASGPRQCRLWVGDDHATLLDRLPAYRGDRWAMPAPRWRVVREHLRPGLRTLETGCGLTTHLFAAAGCRHTALEHDAAHADRCRERLPAHVRLLRRDLTGTPPWYAVAAAELGRFDLILIDGPPGSVGRAGVLRHLPALLAPGGAVLLDDIHRPAERRLAQRVADRVGGRMDVQGGVAAIAMPRPNGLG